MPLELGTTSYSLSQSETQSKTSDISRPAEYDGVFPPPKASSVDLERVVSRLNTVKELQRQLSKGSVKEAKEDPVVPLVGYRVLDSGLSLLQRILAICLAFLNCPLVGQNSLKDFSATGEHDISSEAVLSASSLLHRQRTSLMCVCGRPTLYQPHIKLYITDLHSPQLAFERNISSMDSAPLD